ncbi:two-component system, OmpR family, alkaline phosphatase synthesis response regulator PhoP [Peptoclostridium litorale DSM 5388]|uniref:Stage 0 sporulation protein A homolog n=1 Tax=Peptoclostridium litorale DSM 5388 TaxID=1121324 RepID=A0A069RFQ8_PEPLI|nr:response regulator transcription factor [Peptoclostridium litorale]KDR95030.1 alkaline phosphatase synthesis transcriptional regulatory protein PhoP [Peptoclostridium litorale DSM 5388]SIN76199.1 two-component system, OmpR family, alkaline phosphatase synthesis response regulator PhoP [Peptoclostridium litorale DSM 5388]
MNKRVLVIDDEEHIVELIKFNLELNEFDVEAEYDGLEGYIKVKQTKPDLVLLDLMLPGIDGMEVCKRIRADKDISGTPIIMLTAKNMEDDKIKGLDVGADDYITKPFSVNELVARVNAVLRRYEKNKVNEADSIEIDEIKIDLKNYEVYKNGKKIDLTLKEFELLKLLAQNRGQVLSRNSLLDKIWGYEYFGETRTVDVHIRHLRKKIEDNDKKPKYIETVRGVGYKFK